MTILLILLTFAFGLSQFFAGYLGIAEHLGPIWAIVILTASLFLRFSLPITIGAFFGAMDVWGFHWGLAMLFAAPGLMFLVPGIIASILTAGKR